MARPNKQGLDYFPFDVDFFDDEKITAISGEFGIKGEITAIKLLCAIYRNGYFILWNDLLKYKLLKNLPGVSSELLESIVNRLVLWEFFDKALFDSTHVLTSKGIQRRYFEAVKRRRNNDELPYLIVNVNNNHPRKELLHTKTPQRKEKESKVNNIPPVSPPAAFPLARLKNHVFSCEQAWMDSIGMNRHIPPEEVKRWLEDFFSELEMSGETEKELKDFKKHFNHWLKIQLSEKEKVAQKKKSNFANFDNDQHYEEF